MRRVSAALLFVVPALALLVPPASAQDVDGVIVHATRFPEDVRRLPASTTVIGAEEIRASAARTLPELLEQQVGVTMKDFYGNNAALTSIDLRGFGVTGPQNTLILLDGRRLTDIDLSSLQWAAIPLSGIERIEVLRGTGAVLYGDGASSGVVNIVTRSPLRPGSAFEVMGTAGTFHTVAGQLYGRTTIAGDAGTVGLNASAYGFASNGYRVNNRNEQQNTTFNLRWAFGESVLDLRMGTDAQELRLPGARRVQPSIGLDEYARDPRGAQTPLDYSSRDGKRAGLAFTQRFGEAELNLGLDWRGKDQRSYFDQSGSPIYRADGLDVTTFSPRLRWPFATGGIGHRLTVGVDLNAWRYDSRRANLPQNVARPINRVRVSEDTRAFYVQDLVELSRDTRLSLGWRTERMRLAGTDTLDATAPGFAFNTAAAPAASTQRRNAWEAGVRHALSPAWSAFGRVGRSFRFVNVDEIYENDALFNAQFQILRPQQSTTREAGAEWREAGRSLRVAAFRTDVTDEIHLDPFTTGVGNTNLPPSRRQGFELEATGRASSRLRLRAGYAYTDARFREGVLAGGAFAIGTNLNVAGKRVPLVPAHKLNLGFAWEVSPRTQLSGSLSAVSSQHMDNDEPNTLGVKLPAYGTLDLKLRREFGWGSLALAGNNLTGERYYSYAVRSAFTADRYSVYPLPGRTLALTVEFRTQ